MQLVSFTPNRSISLFHQNYVIVSTSGNSELVLRDDQNVETVWTVESLIGHYISGNLRAGTTITNGSPSSTAKRISTRLVGDVSERSKEEGLARNSYVGAILASGVPIRSNSSALSKVVALVSEKLGRVRSPSFSTIQRWLSKYRRQSGSNSALIPYFDRRGGVGKSRLSTLADLAMKAAIDNVYMTTERYTVTRVHQTLIADLSEKNKWRPKTAQIPIPSYSTFRRAIAKRSGYEVTASREGARTADRRYRSSSSSPENYGLNQCWEIDHSVLDLFVVDQHTGLVLGRPRVTVIVDHFSRSVMGVDIDFSGPSTQAVLNCIKAAILPKTELLKSFPGIVGGWPCYGLPMVIKCDNAPEFHATTLQDACFALGIELQYCPVKQPWFKGRVERFFRTFSEQAMAGLPGATGAHLYKLSEDQNPEKFAVMELQELQAYVYMWIVDVYMTGPQENRGSPLNIWNRFFLIEESFVPGDLDELSVICCESATRVITHIGIEMENCVFNSEELQEIRRRSPAGRKVSVEVKYNRCLMNHIWVTEPTSLVRIQILNSDPATRDLSSQQIGAIRKMQRELQDQGHIVGRAQAFEKLKLAARAQLYAKTQSKRRQARKILGVEMEADQIAPKTKKMTKPKRASKPRVTPHQLLAIGVSPDSPPKKGPDKPDMSPVALPIYNVVTSA
ncbi:DDE-type integrase/transposase/recombinase [Polaromonas sp. AER18D-145]|uniref:integrase catalytic domain-containing protein n=1 Tax=Polaromonas sp. AER18D-145 TaxID=1977060 RepID=UPI000BBC260B|nr:DDE-type integrase/transposase/recombinase [Polaromonas sp. AER18D-145]